MASAKKSGKAASKKSAGAPVAVKYLGPKGETWTDRDLTQRWIKTLIDHGHTKEEFLIAA